MSLYPRSRYLSICVSICLNMCLYMVLTHSVTCSLTHSLTHSTLCSFCIDLKSLYLLLSKSLSDMSLSRCLSRDMSLLKSFPVYMSLPLYICLSMSFLIYLMSLSTCLSMSLSLYPLHSSLSFSICVALSCLCRSLYSRHSRERRHIGRAR